MEEEHPSFIMAQTQEPRPLFSTPLFPFPSQCVRADPRALSFSSGVFFNLAGLLE